MSISAGKSRCTRGPKNLPNNKLPPVFDDECSWNQQHQTSRGGFFKLILIITANTKWLTSRRQATYIKCSSTATAHHITDFIFAVSSMLQRGGRVAYYIHNNTVVLRIQLQLFCWSLRIAWMKVQICNATCIFLFFRVSLHDQRLFFVVDEFCRIIL